jgi:hypothetical protein
MGKEVIDRFSLNKHFKKKNFYPTFLDKRTIEHLTKNIPEYDDYDVASYIAYKRKSYFFIWPWIWSMNNRFICFLKQIKYEVSATYLEKFNNGFN